MFVAIVLSHVGAAPASAQSQAQLAGCNLEQMRHSTLAQVAPNHLMLTGSVEQPVQIDCDELQLFADKVEMFRADGRVVADGHVVFVSGSNRISAERVEFNTKTRTGTFYNASGTAIMRQGTPAQSAGEQEPYAFFWGDELHKVGPTKYKIVRGGFTACVQPTPRWEVSSGTLTLNLDDYVLLTNAIFRVKGVPLLYLPVFYYPMQEDDRATGFILPTYGTATHAGQKLSNGFFWALGRSHDVMFVHDWFTKTGQGAGARYRYMMSPGSQGNARFYWLNEKSITTVNNGVPVTSTPIHELHDQRGSGAEPRRRIPRTGLRGLFLQHRIAAAKPAERVSRDEPDAPLRRQYQRRVARVRVERDPRAARDFRWPGSTAPGTATCRGSQSPAASARSARVRCTSA